MSGLFEGLVAGVGGWIAAFGAIAAAILAAYLKGRTTGRGAERARRAEESLENRKVRDEIEDANAGLPDAALRSRLREWER